MIAALQLLHSLEVQAFVVQVTQCNAKKQQTRRFATELSYIGTGFGF